MKSNHLQPFEFPQLFPNELLRLYSPFRLWRNRYLNPQRSKGLTKFRRAVQNNFDQRLTIILYRWCVWSSRCIWEVKNLSMLFFNRYRTHFPSCFLSVVQELESVLRLLGVWNGWKRCLFPWREEEQTTRGYIHSLLRSWLKSVGII